MSIVTSTTKQPAGLSNTAQSLGIHVDSTNDVPSDFKGASSAASYGSSKRPNEEAMRVVLRLRPPSEKEKREGDGCGFRIVSPTVVELPSQRAGQGAQRYKLDACYGHDASQKDIFDSEVKGQLKRLLQGQNTSVLAYGPTGAGKTFTMVGDKQNPGIIPRSMEKIFQLMTKNQQYASFVTQVSTFEIYNEEVFDLFNAGMKGLPVRQDDKGQVHVPGLTKKWISTFDEFLSLYESAMNNRKVAPTLLNQASSRSHFLLLLTVDRTEKSSGRVYRGKLTFVDLAGSEDNRRTGNMGDRMRESGNINKSLLALNNLVTQLNKKAYPNYRQSCLTRMLKDCLGGNSYSCLFANVAQNNYHDTFSTLNFAKKGMKVMCKPVVAESNPNATGKENQAPPTTLARHSHKTLKLSGKTSTLSGKKQLAHPVPVRAHEKENQPPPNKHSSKLNKSSTADMNTSTAKGLQRRALSTLGGNAHDVQRTHHMNAMTAKRLTQKGDKLMCIMKSSQALAFYQRAQTIQPGCKDIARKIREVKLELKYNKDDTSDVDYDPEEDVSFYNDDSFIEEITRKRPPASRPEDLTRPTVSKQSKIVRKLSMDCSTDRSINQSLQSLDTSGLCEPVESGSGTGIALKLDKELVNMLEERLLQSLNTYPVKRLRKELRGVGPKRADLIIEERSTGPYVTENVTNFISLVH